jgi:predicted amidophosphoribosyltransferase
MTLGLVCDACDALSPINATVCQLCGHSLGVARASSARPVLENQGTPRASEPLPAAGAAQSAAGARNCPFCGAEVAPNHRFCGSCGKPVGPASAPAPQPMPSPAGLRPGKTMFFGAMQAPSPKLILIKGEGLDGVTYVLSATEHIAGRLEGRVTPTSSTATAS